MSRFFVFALIVSELLFIPQEALTDSPERLPNIVVIMADDLGYGDLSCYGATEISTPHIDRLATEGVRFTSGYCSASTCTPTRYSFLTGNYAFRTKGTGIAPPNSPALIQPGTETIASVLKKAGYRTAVIGKWHLGLGEKGKGPDWNGQLNPGPLEIGFDQCFLLPTTNDRVPQVYVEDHQVLNLDPADPLWVGNKKPSDDHPTGITHRDTLKMDWTHGHNSTIHNGISRIGFYTGGHAARFRDEDLADKWVEKSKAFMQTNKNKPFFLFFSSHDLHVPRMPHERFQGKTKLGFRGDAIAQLDWCVGELTKSLDELGIADNTLVVFCSDNGPVMDDGYADGALEKVGKHRAAGIYKGGKYSVFEGGCRTPFITRWTGKIKPGSSDEMICTIDMARSFAGLAHQSVAEGSFTDSVDVMDAFLGTPSAQGRQELVLQDNGKLGTFGYIQRDGDKRWKLHRYDSGTAFNVVVETKRVKTKRSKIELFELASDPEENNSLKLADHAERVAAMTAELKELAP